MKERGLRVKLGEGGQEGGQVDVAGIRSLTYTSRCQDLPLSLLRRRRRISKPVQTENESFRVGFPLLAARARARRIKLQVEFLTIRVSQKVGVCTWQQLCEGESGRPSRRSRYWFGVQLEVVDASDAGTLSAAVKGKQRAKDSPAGPTKILGP